MAGGVSGALDMAGIIDQPPHGGDLQAASARYDRPMTQWLDLSTGINPNAYPVPPIAPAAWHNLPYVNSALVAAARAAYAVPDTFAITPTPGSQPVIMALPRLLPKYSVLLPQWGYADHGAAWQAADAHCLRYTSCSAAAQIAAIDAALADNPRQHVVLIQPNNPTGVLLPPAQLRHWAAQLVEGARMIIDETFIDATPAQSVCPEHLHPAMIVLRSVGKFYGLAGLRLGFVLTEPGGGQLVQAELGPWSVSGPAQVVGQQALTDVGWQTQMRLELAQSQHDHAHWLLPLESFTERVTQHLPLFSTCWLLKENARRLVHLAGQQGILVRCLPGDDRLDMLRLGRLQRSDIAGLQRLQHWLQLIAQ